MKPKDFDLKTCRDFSEIDPFNPAYRLSGKISFSHSNTYGSLLLESVVHTQNGKRVDFQDGYVIPATPKLRYPFGREGNWLFPSATEIEVFRKYDGTNIFAYRYPDPSGHLQITYKTRGLPFLFPDFEVMWRKMLETYPDIPKLFSMNPTLDGFAFEMFGKLNHILIEYDTSLDTRLLFARKGDAIVSATEIESANIPKADHIGTVNDNYVWNYEKAQEEMEAELKPIEDGFKGDEGHIWYLTNKETGLIQMYKCKPPTIQKEHWSNAALPRVLIRTTAQNTLEQTNETSVALVKQFLIEEFTETQVEMSTKRITQIVIEVNIEHKRHLKIKARLADINYLSLDLPTIMRSIHQHFEKSEMRRVGSYVKSLKELGIQLK